MAVPTRLSDEQERRREKLCKVLAELKIDLISVSEAIRHQLVSVLARRLDAFAVDDDDVGHTTLIDIELRRTTAYPSDKGHARYPTRLASLSRESSTGCYA